MMCNNKNFVIITDSASNLTEEMLKKYDVKMLPYIINIDGEDVLCYEEGIDLNELAAGLYNKMRGGAKTKTTLVNGERFKEFIEPYLIDGSDVLFVSLSSGVSGTYNSINNACKELSEKYKDRKCLALDTLGASMGEGLIVLEAVRMREEGIKINDVFDALVARRMKMRQIFTVDNLEYLLRGGRISKLTAVVGTILHIKPLLMGNDEGKIVSYAKVKGKKRALDTLAQEFVATAVEPEKQVISVSHCDALEDANYLVSKIKEKTQVKDIIIVMHDMCTGSYLGPGSVALYFWGRKK